MRRFNSTILEKFDEFDLLLKGMPIGTQDFSYHLGDDFFRNMESADVSADDVDVALSVKHVGDIYELCFTVSGVISIPCDRCLDPMQHHVDTTYVMDVKYGDEYREGDDQVVLPHTIAAFNVARVIYDTVMLTIPIMHVHPDGECNEEMSRLLARHAAGAATNADEDGDGDMECDPRWEALKRLTDNN